ncbi:MAG: P1 family peptidase [Acidobacteria bacterium]|nr:P1 family peptidase [Acidobacteriota bacterium]
MRICTRREFHQTLSLAAFSRVNAGRLTASTGAAQSASPLEPAGGLTDVEGLKVGHFTHPRRLTGCTVVLAEKGAVAGVDVRGAAPGTRETDLLDPVNTVQRVHAILLAGGSAFGLEAAGGVLQYLEEKGIGFETRVAKVPIVPAAILFDLEIGDPTIRPDKASGYAACRNAVVGPIKEGNIGAGAGATVGKILGSGRAMKSGLGTASIRVGNLVVAALAAVNAAGDVYDFKNGRIVAGARTPDGGRLANTIETLKKNPVSWGGRQSSFNRGWNLPPVPFAPAMESTTLGVVATNAAFDKAGMTKIAQMAHDGYARAINPVHTPGDGDTIFALSTEAIPGGSGPADAAANIGLVGSLAAEVMAQAILRAALTAEGIPGYPAARDLK